MGLKGRYSRQTVSLLKREREKVPAVFRLVNLFVPLRGIINLRLAPVDNIANRWIGTSILSPRSANLCATHKNGRIVKILENMDGKRTLGTFYIRLFGVLILL